MSNTGEFYPDGAVKKEGGVMVVPSGYGGMAGSTGTIKVPTHVGSGLNETQFEVVPIVVQTIDGGAGLPTEAPVEAPVAVAVPEAALGTSVDPFDDIPAVRPPVVESVGESADIGAIQVPRNTESRTESTEGHIDAVQGVGVKLTHSTGFAFTTDWNLVAVTAPLEGVTTLALGLNPEKELTIPEGDYTVEVEGDVYAAYFGNQSFQSDLKYYIFVVK